MILQGQEITRNFGIPRPLLARPGSMALDAQSAPSMADIRLFSGEYAKLTSMIRALNAQTGSSFSMGRLDEVRFADGYALVPLQGMSDVSWGRLLTYFRAEYCDADIIQTSNTRYQDEVILHIGFPQPMSAGSRARKQQGLLQRLMSSVGCCCCCFRNFGMREWLMLAVLCGISYYYLVERMLLSEKIFSGSAASWTEQLAEIVYEAFYPGVRIAQPVVGARTGGIKDL